MVILVVVVVAYIGMDGCNIGSGGRGGGSAVDDGGSGYRSIDIDCGQISGCGGGNGGVNSSGRNSDGNGGRGQPM